jgi:hypothetical protein
MIFLFKSSKGIKFYKNMAYIIHILNFNIQDILKIIIKDEYNSLNNNIISIENDEEENISNKFF